MAVDINDRPNLQVRTNAAGVRRRTTSKNDPIASEMEKADRPNDVAKLAAKYGINDEEIMERAKSAPNFGQFRMVIGNRLRGIQKRLDKAKTEGTRLTKEDAAYPKKIARKPRESSAKTSKKTSKKVAKKTISSPADDPRTFLVTENEANEMAKAHGELYKVKEFSSEEAALKALKAKGPGDFVAVHNGTKDKVGERILLCGFKPKKSTPATKKVGKKVGKKVSKKQV